MSWPRWHDWLFSAKTFAAAMLALFIALYFDLPRPYWALAAVYIVSNPLAGATSSKGLFRAVGTLLGAFGSVLLVPLFIQSPEIFCLVLALWTGVLLYLSMLDRTARSYLFMLAGYSLAIIALPAVDAPDSIFDLAVARTEEILIGITCASVVGMTVFPTSVATLLSSLIKIWLGDASRWACLVLRGDAEGVSPSTPLSRQKLAADVAGLDHVISQLAYDADARDLVGSARELRGRLLMLLPVLSSLADRLHSLASERGQFSPEFRSLLHRVADWMESDALPDKAELFRAEIERIEPTSPAMGWDAFIATGALERLRELIDLWEDCLLLQNRISGRATSMAQPLRFRRTATAARHHDHGMMAFSSGMVVLSVLAACAIWISTGWNAGAGFVMMAAVAGSFFAQSDTPARLIVKMFIWTLASLPVAAVYLFGLMPLARDFGTLMLLFAPLLLVLCAFATRASLSLATNMLMVNVAMFVALQNRYGADFVSFANSGLAAVAGTGFAWLWATITRPFGAEFAARRLIGAGWTDLAELAEGNRLRDHDDLSARMLDRLGQLVPRLAGLANRRLTEIDGLAELRVGFNILSLQEQRSQLSVPATASIDAVLSSVSAFYRRRLAHRHIVEPDDDLRERIDTALRAGFAEGAARRVSINALVGLRRALFPHARPPEIDRSGIMPVTPPLPDAC